jgi:integrase
MKLIALTFVRTSELIGARWSEFDFEEKRLNIPAERMKMRTPYIVRFRPGDRLLQMEPISNNNHTECAGENC